MKILTLSNYYTTACGAHNTIGQKKRGTQLSDGKHVGVNIVP